MPPLIRHAGASAEPPLPPRKRKGKRKQKKNMNPPARRDNFYNRPGTPETRAQGLARIGERDE